MTLRDDIDDVNRALGIVRDGLRNGSIPAHDFDMRWWGNCGTAACIGGLTERLLLEDGLVDAAEYVRNAQDYDPALTKLFYPWGPGGPPEHFHREPASAADAIDRHFAGSEPWAGSV